jgi:glycosyltransferase involved in cell wall biosynthesis
LIEALACGVPVAAFPVQGPIDILGPSSRGIYDQIDQAAGALDVSLSAAIVKAQGASRQAAAELGASFDWKNAVTSSSMHCTMRWFRVRKPQPNFKRGDG